MLGFNPGLARDLLLLGMSFKVEEKENRPRRALMFFRAFFEAGLIDEGTRKRLMEDPESIQRVLDDCHVLQQSSKPRRWDLLGLAYEVEKSFILIGPKPNQRLDRRRILGGDGYHIMITDAGLTSAEELVRAYASMIDLPRFCDAWDWSWSLLGKQWGAMKKRRKLASSSESDNSRREIPPAPRAPEEWEW